MTLYAGETVEIATSALNFGNGERLLDVDVDSAVCRVLGPTGDVLVDDQLMVWDGARRVFVRLWDSPPQAGIYKAGVTWRAVDGSKSEEWTEFRLFARPG